MMREIQHEGAINSLKELLRESECANVEELEDQVYNYLDDPYLVEVDVDDTGVNVNVGSNLQNTGARATFPFALRDFWLEIDRAEEINKRKLETFALPTVEFNPAGLPDNDDLIEDLARLFEMDRHEFEQAFGNGWFTESDNAQGPVGPHEAVRWVLSGDSEMVALGLGGEWIYVGVPKFIPASSPGNPFEVDVATSIDVFNSADPIDEISRAIARLYKPPRLR